jgi:hypothetical protein
MHHRYDVTHHIFNIILQAYSLMQANKSMSRFRNKGWKYFAILDEIMPGSAARGAHAFLPMNTTASGEPEEVDDEEGVTEAAGSLDHSSSANTAAMEVDRDGDGSTLISPSMSKRKFVTEDDTITLNSGQAPPSSIHGSVSSLPSSTLSLEPSRKKGSKAVSLSSRSQLKVPTRRSKAASSGISSSSRAGSSRGVTNISSDLLVHDMQGSINMLTSTVRDSMESDPVMKVRQSAVRLLQTRDDGLSSQQKILLFHKFSNQHALTQTYLAIDDDELRRAWLLELCDN